jgi:uncharacterized protein
VTAPASPTLRYISHDDFLRDVEGVAAAIDGSGWRPDFLVGIGRGGLIPAAYLSHRLDIPMLSIDHSSKVFGFGDELLGKLAALIGEGRRVLFVDDINDSGSTIAYVRDKIAGLGSAMDRLGFAVLIDNVRSVARVEYRSRTIDRAVDKDWFVFPWEAVAPRATLIEEALEVPERLA